MRDGARSSSDAALEPCPPAPVSWCRQPSSTSFVTPASPCMLAMGLLVLLRCTAACSTECSTGRRVTRVSSGRPLGRAAARATLWTRDRRLGNGHRTPFPRDALCQAAAMLVQPSPHHPNPRAWGEGGAAFRACRCCVLTRLQIEGRQAAAVAPVATMICRRPGAAHHRTPRHACAAASAVCLWTRPLSQGLRRSLLREHACRRCQRRTCTVAPDQDLLGFRVSRTLPTLTCGTYLAPRQAVRCRRLGVAAAVAVRGGEVPASCAGQAVASIQWIRSRALWKHAGDQLQLQSQ